MSATDRMAYRTSILLVTLLVAPAPSSAQTVTLGSDLLFYGDNTEFTNPFRSGETTFGISGTVFVDIALNDLVTVRAGLFGLGRFGAHEFLEHAEPAVALEIARDGSRFVFGSLHTVATRQDVAGPDLETPHRLLPPIQQETLTFSRGQEMGVQWIVERAQFEHDAWINWQRLNTAAHRERFDGGYRASVALHDSLRLIGQWHLVHEGGQQFRSGAVSDSQAGALGLQWSHPIGAIRTTLEGHGVGTRDVPNRDADNPPESGIGVFLRGAIESGPWRGHAIAWRGRHVLKSEGDSNYLSQQADGAVFWKVRDYAELGLTRHFRPAPGVHMSAAFRIHRIEAHYEYSYRIVGRVRLRKPL